MKVAVLNYTGTVGKTTISAHLLSPRMGNAPIFAIETINETAHGLGVDVEKLSGEKFRELFKRLMVLDDAIVDVGASNVEAFLDGMVKFEDSHLEFDAFLVPVTSGSKEQKETLHMIATLADFGIPADRIHIVFNRVAGDVADEFGAMLNYVKKAKNCIANPDTAIYDNELFDLLAVKKMTIGAIMADETDYRTLARTETDAKQRTHYTDMHVMRALSKSVTRNLDAVYAALWGPK